MPQNSEFFQKLSDKDFARLLKENWVDRETLEVNKVSRVTTEVGAKLLGRKQDNSIQKKINENTKTTYTNDFAGLCFPNLLPNEEKPRCFWVLRDNPDFVEKEGFPKEWINPIATPLNQPTNSLFFPQKTTDGQIKGNFPIIIAVGLLASLAIKRSLNQEFLSKSLFTSLNENTLVIGLSNEWAWRNKKDENGKKLEKTEVIKDFDLITWENRTVFLVFNSDVLINEFSNKARAMLKKELESRNANVQLIDLPIVSGVNSIDQLLAHQDWEAEKVLDLFCSANQKEKNSDATTTITTNFKFYSLREVLDFDDPEMLLSNILPENAFAVIFGQSGVGKSFLALHFALTISLGKTNYFPVKKGHVIYISAEGKAGVKKRVKAWLDNFNNSEILNNFHYLFSPLNALNADEVTSFTNQTQEICKEPKLIIIDTFARCLIGGDENSARDVGAFIAGCDLLKEATRATILLVHHTSKNTNIERGSSALRGAADTMILVESANFSGKTFLTAKCEKQKDSERFEDLSYELTKFEDSCVLIPSEHIIQDKKTNAEQKKKDYLNLFITDDPNDKGLKRSTIRKLLALPEATMNQITKKLCNDGLTRRNENLVYITEKGKNWLKTYTNWNANATNDFNR